MNESLIHRITLDPKLMTGKPVIRGTRIPVELLVRMQAQGLSDAEILKEYPCLQADDLRAALTYAAHVLSQERVFPILASTE